ncbi:tetratricopeptide repeat protein [Methanosarcina sp. MSH10X1]|uniref:tetratricopeptide repeat protein n=1 Tax=Methanosarcina sp. MSH10X1 TaxID=2507075 RepID=UPI000FFBB6CC|nr:tetratricopeptide repeat protein [Methanosarcina sp. MSH10X1]RXA15587.1 tetratricopeptide repeat protein [Methanosarcina sp. MSH10X1]
MICRKQASNAPEWDPPAPSTVYIKIKNIPYEIFKTRLNEGLVTTELDQIRYRLERRIYCCGVCSKQANGYCVITNRKIEPGWICKSFVPKEEFIYLDIRPGSEASPDFRYLSETGLRKNHPDGGIPEESCQKNAESLYEEGVTLYRQGRLRLALEAFETVLSENPGHFPALFHKGNTFLKLKRYEEALETFESASRMNPDHPGLWTNSGFALVKLERFSQALEAFERSISLNPVQKNAWEGKDAVLARIRQCEEDLKESEKALEKNSEDSNIWFEKGKLHLKLGELEKSREAFEKALEGKPGNAEAWHLRGRILSETGSEKAALHAFEKATRQKPDFPDAWYEKGRVFLKLANPKGAENAIKIAADLWESRGFKTQAETARTKIKKPGSEEK